MVPSLGNYSAYTFHGSVWRVEELVRAACGLGYGAGGRSGGGGVPGGGRRGGGGVRAGDAVAGA